MAATRSSGRRRTRAQARSDADDEAAAAKAAAAAAAAAPAEPVPRADSDDGGNGGDDDAPEEVSLQTAVKEAKQTRKRERAAREEAKRSAKAKRKRFERQATPDAPDGEGGVASDAAADVLPQALLDRLADTTAAAHDPRVEAPATTTANAGGTGKHTRLTDDVTVVVLNDRDPGANALALEGSGRGTRSHRHDPAPLRIAPSTSMADAPAPVRYSSVCARFPAKPAQQAGPRAIWQRPWWHQARHDRSASARVPLRPPRSLWADEAFTLIRRAMVRVGWGRVGWPPSNSSQHALPLLLEARLEAVQFEQICLELEEGAGLGAAKIGKHVSVGAREHGRGALDPRTMRVRSVTEER